MIYSIYLYIDPKLLIILKNQYYILSIYIVSTLLTMLKEQSNIYSIISMFCPKIVNNVKKKQYNIFIYVYCNHIVNNVKETV